MQTEVKENKERCNFLQNYSWLGVAGYRAVDKLVLRNE